MFKWFRMGSKLNPGGKVIFFIGMCFISIFIISLATAQGTYSGAGERVTQRSIEVDLDKKVDTKLRAKYFHSVDDGFTYGYYFEPNDNNAPLPPGMKKWIDKGQAVLSPALIEKYPMGSISPWGKVVGVIPIENLVSPIEKFFYAIPSENVAKNWGDKVTGFIDLPIFDGTGDFQSLREFSFIYLLMFLVLTILIPGIAFVILGLHQGFNIREYSQLLEKIGCNTKNRFVIGVGSYIRPIIINMVVFALMVFCLSFYDIYLPIVNVQLVANDFYPQIFITIFSFIIFTLVILFLCGLNALVSIKIKSSTKFSKIISRISQLSFLPTIVFVVLFLCIDTNLGPLLVVLFMLSMFSLSFAIPILSIWVSEGLIWLVSKLKKGLSLVASRKLTANTNFFVSFLIGFSAIIICFGSLQTMAIQYDENMNQAIKVNEIIGKNANEISTKKYTKGEVENLAERINNDFGAVIVTAGNEGIYALTKKDYKVLEILKVDKNKKSVDVSTLDKKMKLIFESSGIEKISIVDEIPKADYISILVFSDKELDRDKINAIASSVGEKVQNLGETWLSLATILSNNKNWFILFGLPSAFAFLFVIVSIAQNTIVSRLDISKLIEVLSLSKANVMYVLFLLVFVPTAIASIFSYFGFKIIEKGLSMQDTSYVVDVNPWFGIGMMIIGIILGLYLMFVTYKKTIKGKTI